VILDALSDPGNAGTIARTALAAGAGYVAATEGTVDLFAPKVVRAGMGAHFGLSLYTDLRWEEIRGALPSVTLVAARADGEDSMYDFVWPERSALVVGSEAHGLSEDAQRAIERTVRIPMKRGVESLNASVAASILMYDAVRPHPAKRYK
jgi:TrmH family RNA methyltransferase